MNGPGFKTLISWSPSWCILGPRNFSLIRCSWATTSIMFILSLGSSIEQETPISNIKIKHSRILRLPIQFWMWVSFVLVSISSFSKQRVGSTMSMTRSGKLLLQNHEGSRYLWTCYMWVSSMWISPTIVYHNYKYDYWLTPRFRYHILQLHNIYNVIDLASY